MSTSSPPFLANFDSAAAMLKSLANFLHGRDFPLLGAMPRRTGPLMKIAGNLVNRMPKPLQEQIYIWSGWNEAIAADNIHKAQMEKVAEWAVGLYPKRKYPAIAIGSSNGAATHLWAALGIPWLPQTFLVPVARSGVHPDEPEEDMKWAEEPSRVFLEVNPDVQLHHMHDPNQDRLMIQRMTYFRAKLRRPGPSYESFIRQSLEPGGVIFIVDCGLKWPTRRQGDRLFFQFGALGGATIEEYMHGGERVRDYLARHGSHRRGWRSPETNDESPEAEWGFETSLQDELEQFARKHHYQIRRVAFDEPEHMSPLTADLYRHWNRERGVVDNRLLVESFILMEPYWTIRTGSVPFWMVFNKEPSADALEQYLAGADPFDEILMMLFSHGVDSVGLVPIERWQKLAERAGTRGELVGVDKEAYPRDFAVFVRYYYDLIKKVEARYPMPPHLTLDQLDAHLARTQGRYRVQWDWIER